MPRALLVGLPFRYTRGPDCTQFFADICNNHTSFTARYKSLARALRSSAFEWLVGRSDSRTLDRVTNDHFGISQIIMRSQRQRRRRKS
jgi:hypothetical protein